MDKVLMSKNSLAILCLFLTIQHCIYKELAFLIMASLVISIQSREAFDHMNGCVFGYEISKLIITTYFTYSNFN